MHMAKSQTAFIGRYIYDNITRNEILRNSQAIYKLLQGKWAH